MVLCERIPPFSFFSSTIVAPAPSAKIMESLSLLSTVLDRVSVPITKHFFAIPALMNADAWITPSSHPGHPNIRSYATQLTFLIFILCFTIVATEGRAMY